MCIEMSDSGNLASHVMLPFIVSMNFNLGNTL